MNLYRNGHRYMVYFSIDRLFIYDSSTDTATADLDSQRFHANQTDVWRMVFDHDPIPDGLIRLLILPFRRRPR